MDRLPVQIGKGGFSMVELQVPNKTVDEFVSAVKQVAATLSRYDDPEGVHLSVSPTVVRGLGGRIVRVDLDVTESTYWTLEKGADVQVQVTRETGRTWFLARSEGGTLHVKGSHCGPSRLSVLSNVLDGLRKVWPDLAYEVHLLRAWLDAECTKFQDPVCDEPPAQVVEAGDPGRPGLDRQELAYRLRAALRARELRAKGRTWREAAQALQWRYGSGPSGIKLLQDAEQRLRRLQSNDPDGLLSGLCGQT